MIVPIPWVAVRGHRVDVAAEEARVVDARLPGQRLDAGARGQAGPWLGEAHVAVAADAQNLQVDSPAAATASSLAAHAPRMSSASPSGPGICNV
jgi:hypothetical protein